MNKKCPKCGHINTFDTGEPDTECPKCGIVYQKYRQTTQKRPILAEQEATISEAASAGGSDNRVSGVVQKPTGIKRYLGGLIVILVILITVPFFLKTSRPNAIPDPAASEVRNFAYDIRGRYRGSGLRLYVDQHHKYEMQILIDENYRVEYAKWTQLKTSSQNTTIEWTGPGTISILGQTRQPDRDNFWIEGATTQVYLENDLLSIFHETPIEKEKIQKFELLDFHVWPPPIAPATDGIFRLNPETGCLSTTLTAKLPPIKSAAVSREQADVVFDALNARLLLDQIASKNPNFQRKTVLPYRTFEVTSFEIDNTIIDFNIRSSPFYFDFQIVDPLAVRKPEGSIIAEKEDTLYTLSTEFPELKIEIIFNKDGQSYALNERIHVSKVWTPDADHPKEAIFLKYDLQKVE